MNSNTVLRRLHTDKVVEASSIAGVQFNYPIQSFDAYSLLSWSTIDSRYVRQF
jgi:hypothetical protein